MLYECNYPKLLMMKFFPLLVAIASVFLVIPVIRAGDWIVLLPIAVVTGMALLLFRMTLKKLRYVAIGSTKIIVQIKGNEHEFLWTDVESLTLYAFIGLYRIKLHQYESFYFTPYGTVTWLTGDESEMGVIITKMKRELSI